LSDERDIADALNRRFCCIRDPPKRRPDTGRRALKRDMSSKRSPCVLNVRNENVSKCKINFLVYSLYIDISSLLHFAHVTKLDLYNSLAALRFHGVRNKRISEVVKMQNVFKSVTNQTDRASLASEARWKRVEAVEELNVIEHASGSTRVIFAWSSPGGSVANRENSMSHAVEPIKPEPVIFEQFRPT